MWARCDACEKAETPCAVCHQARYLATIDPFNDEAIRARDLNALLIAHAQVSLAQVGDEMADAIADAHVALERLEHVRGDLNLWTDNLARAIALRDEIDNA